MMTVPISNIYNDSMILRLIRKCYVLELAMYDKINTCTVYKETTTSTMLELLYKLQIYSV